MPRSNFDLDPTVCAGYACTVIGHACLLPTFEPNELRRFSGFARDNHTTSDLLDPLCMLHLFTYSQNNAIIVDRGSARRLNVELGLCMRLTQLLSVWITKLLSPSYPAYSMYVEHPRWTVPGRLKL